MALGRYDSNQQAVFKKNRLLRLQTFGPTPILDLVQKEVLGDYQLRRRRTHPDRGLDVTDVVDPVRRRLLLGMDDVFLDERAEDHRVEIEKAKAAAGKRPRVPRKKEIGEQ